MSTEAPTVEPQAKSAFAAAFDKAMETAPTIPDEPGAETAAPKKEPKEPKAPAKEPTAPPEKKATTPRELFKKAEPAKGGDATAAEPKSPLDEIAPPDFKGDAKAKNAWDNIKSKASEFEGLAKTRESKLKELEAKLADAETLKTQLAEREAQLKEYSELVTRARLEDHPDFRKEFVDGRQKLIARAKTIIEESGGDPKSVETALNLTGKARVDALEAVSENLGKFQTGILGRVIDELTDLDERAQAKRAAASKSVEELRERERQQQAETSATKARTRGIQFDDTVRRLGSELEVLQKSEGHDDWNARADRIVKEARAFVDEHPESNIEAEIYSRALPAYRDLFIQADQLVEAKDKKIAELEAELRTIHGKSPSLRGAPSRQPAGEKSVKPFSEAFSNITTGAE